MRSVSSTLGASVPRPVRLLLVTDSVEVGGGGASRRGSGGRALPERVRGRLRRPGLTRAIARRGGGAGQTATRPKVKRRLSLGYTPKLRRLVRRARFDLVHAHVYASAASAALATSGLGVPLVVTEQSEALWQGRGARSVSRFVYWRARRHITVSSAVRRRLIKRDGVHPNLSTVVPNAVTTITGTPAFPPELPAGLGEGPLVGVVLIPQIRKYLYQQTIK